MADDILEVLRKEPPENLRISVLGPVEGKYAVDLDLWNGPWGAIRGLARLGWVFKSKKAARAAMQDFLSRAKE